MDSSGLRVALAVGIVVLAGTIGATPTVLGDDPCIIVDTSDPAHPRTYVDPNCVNNGGSPSPAPGP